MPKNIRVGGSDFCLFMSDFYLLISGQNVYWCLAFNEVTIKPMNNIKFNHMVEVFNVCCGPRSILMTEANNPWLNVIITHPKFISNPFIRLYGE